VFFFQAEDGIRDKLVTGVQTCALPIYVPAYNWWNEGLHGVARAGIATVFPQAIGIAATCDTDLVHRVAEVISTEARAKYNDAIQIGRASCRERVNNPVGGEALKNNEMK